MSYNDPTHWRTRAEDMRALAEKMKGAISKHMMHRIAEDYERLARTVEQRVNPFSRAPEPVPAKLRPFANRKSAVSAPLAQFPDVEIPDFLRRGPATVDEAPAVSTTGQGIDHDNKGRAGGGPG